MSTQIPISFRQQQPQQQGYEQQQYGQSGSSMYGQGQREQPSWQQQQQYGKEGMFGQREQQQQYGQQGQQAQYGKEGTFQRDQQPSEQGGGTSMWEKVKEAFTPSSSREYDTQQREQYRGGQTQTMGKWITKDLQANNVSAGDLTSLHLLLLQAGDCYIKEHVFMKLCEDRQGFVKNWHKNVTIRNLDELTNLAKSWGLSLPFKFSLEQREQEIKRALGNINYPVLTDAEVVKDLKCSGCLLEQHLAQAFFLSSNEQVKSVAQKLCGNVCDNVNILKKELMQQDEFFHIPIVKTIVCKEGIHDRR